MPLDSSWALLVSRARKEVSLHLAMDSIDTYVSILSMVWPARLGLCVLSEAAQGGTWR